MSIESDEVQREVVRLFAGTSRPNRQRAKPHRCLGCGKVTKHVFCPSTYETCRALYQARQA